jgi:hypothetical protein
VHTETAFVLTILVLCYAMVSGLVRKCYLAPALIFVALGAIVGRFGIGLVNAGEHTAACPLAPHAFSVRSTCDISGNLSPCVAVRDAGEVAHLSRPTGYSGR